MSLMIKCICAFANTNRDIQRRIIKRRVSTIVLMGFSLCFLGCGTNIKYAIDDDNHMIKGKYNEISIDAGYDADLEQEWYEYKSSSVDNEKQMDVIINVFNKYLGNEGVLQKNQGYRNEFKYKYSQGETLTFQLYSFMYYRETTDEWKLRKMAQTKEGSISKENALDITKKLCTDMGYILDTTDIEAVDEGHMYRVNFKARLWDIPFKSGVDLASLQMSYNSIDIFISADGIEKMQMEFINKLEGNAVKSYKICDFETALKQIYDSKNKDNYWKNCEALVNDVSLEYRPLNKIVLPTWVIHISETKDNETEEYEYTVNAITRQFFSATKR